MPTRKSASAEVFKISISSEKGQKKHNVAQARVAANGGIEGDTHCDSDRPLSLLPLESFGKLDYPGLNIKPGDFAENITTRGLDFRNIRIGSRLAIGDKIEIEIIQIGKECHNGCRIRELTGDCIMPNEGVFARTITPGEIKEGDPITIL